MRLKIFSFDKNIDEALAALIKHFLENNLENSKTAAHNPLLQNNKMKLDGLLYYYINIIPTL